MAKQGTLRRITSYAARSHPEFWHGAKYRLYRYLLRNPSSRRKLNSHKPALDSVQSEIVSDLSERGIAFSSFEKLFADGPRWEQLEKAMDIFSKGEKVQDGIRDYHEHFQKAGGAKEYVIKQYPRFVTVDPEDVWLQLGLDSRLLDTVNSYLGLWAKLIHFDIWYTVPLAADRPPVASQQWHRDPEDEKLIKVFLYFSDVDEGSGPLQYVPGTFPGGPYENIWRKTSVLDATYPPAGDFEKVLPRSKWTSCIGPAGTLVLCDTNGFHRGGFATSKARLLATWTFVTPASLFPRRFNIDPNRSGSELSGAARFAIT